MQQRKTSTRASATKVHFHDLTSSFRPHRTTLDRRCPRDFHLTAQGRTVRAPHRRRRRRRRRQQQRRTSLLPTVIASIPLPNQSEPGKTTATFASSSWQRQAKDASLYLQVRFLVRQNPVRYCRGTRLSPRVVVSEWEDKREIRTFSYHCRTAELHCFLIQYWTSTLVITPNPTTTTTCSSSSSRGRHRTVHRVRRTTQGQIRTSSGRDQQMFPSVQRYHKTGLRTVLGHYATAQLVAK